MIKELYVLFIFSIIGVLIGILFDIFRILRKTFKTPNIITYIEDFLFWLLTGFLVLYGIITYADGEIRLYTILIIIIGVIIYYISISKYFIIINSAILNIIKKILTFLFVKIKHFFKIITLAITKNIKKLKKFSKSSGK